jgi:protein PhnA
MNISPALQARANGICEITGEATEQLFAYTIPPKNDDSLNHQVAVSQAVLEAINNNDYSNTNIWRSVTGSIWSEVPAVQVLSYKILTQLKSNDWALEALDGCYLDEALITWANAEAEALANAVIHKDAFGAILQSGDNVLLTENLNVKGTNFIAPKGTKVLKIRLVHDNAEQIEGKINGSTIVILTKFVRKG